MFIEKSSTKDSKHSILLHRFEVMIDYVNTKVSDIEKACEKTVELFEIIYASLDTSNYDKLNLKLLGDAKRNLYNWKRHIEGGFEGNYINAMQILIITSLLDYGSDFSIDVLDKLLCELYKIK